MRNSKNVIMVILIIVILGLLGAQVMATNDDPITNLDNLNLEIGTTNEVNDTTNQEAVNQEVVNEVVNQEVVNYEAPAIVQPDTNIENEEDEPVEGADEKLPQTGVTEDITVMFFIVVCAVSAVYAYKKIRDYNV